MIAKVRNNPPIYLASGQTSGGTPAVELHAEISGYDVNLKIVEPSWLQQIFGDTFEKRVNRAITKMEQEERKFQATKEHIKRIIDSQQIIENQRETL